MRQKRIILIDVVEPTVSKTVAEEHLVEIISLIKTYGGGEVVKMFQRRTHPHPATYMGPGKAEEICNLILEQHVDIVIVNGILSTTQSYRLTQLFWTANPLVEVWDRVDLILQIFQKHAHTAESKLQIELAHTRHMGPRMYGLSEELGRQGTGTRSGSGQTNIELMKKHWKENIRGIEKKLKELEMIRQRQMDRRKESGLLTVSLVGYTNAGKTTLFNALTGKRHLAKDILFATLDSTVGKVFLPALRKTIMVSDTIGFIKDLPLVLIDAFKSTLLESVHADIIFHVVDSADPHVFEHIITVNDILHQLGISPEKTVMICNKIDLAPKHICEELKRYNEEKEMLFISAHSPLDVSRCIEFIQSLIANPRT